MLKKKIFFLYIITIYSELKYIFSIQCSRYLKIGKTKYIYKVLVLHLIFVYKTKHCFTITLRYTVERKDASIVQILQK